MNEAPSFFEAHSLDAFERRKIANPASKGKHQIAHLMLSSAQKVTLKVFDLTGKEVATLLRNEHRAAGVHALTFNAQHLPSGVYLYRLQAGEFVETKRMVLIR